MRGCLWHALRQDVLVGTASTGRDPYDKEAPDNFRPLTVRSANSTWLSGALGQEGSGARRLNRDRAVGNAGNFYFSALVADVHCVLLLCCFGFERVMCSSILLCICCCYLFLIFKLINGLSVISSSMLINGLSVNSSSMLII